jgi:hypothetical protein
MKETKNIKKNYNIAKTLTPLLNASLIKKRDLKELFMEVDRSVGEILEESKLYKNLTNQEKAKVTTDLYELFSTMLASEVLNNNNTYIEETKEEVLYIFDKIPNFLKKININDESFNKLIQSGLTYIIKEAYSFHNTLYLSDIITLNEMRVLSLKVIKTAIKSIALLLNYIKTQQKDSNIKLQAENFKMSGYIYSIGLSSLFEYLSKDEKRIKDYLKNQEKYIKKIDKTFIENYTILTKTTKLISEEIKN